MKITGTHIVSFLGVAAVFGGTGFIIWQIKKNADAAKGDARDGQSVRWHVAQRLVSAVHAAATVYASANDAVSVDAHDCDKNATCHSCPWLLATGLGVSPRHNNGSSNTLCQYST